MSITFSNQTNDSLKVLLQKTNAVTTVNEESIQFIQSRKAQNVILKYNYKLNICETRPSKRKKIDNDTSPTRNTSKHNTVQIRKTKQTRPVNDIINSWTYTGDPMTELLPFGDFINANVSDFESLISLHNDYTVLYERYSRLLKDEPESREAVLVLLRNVERVQEAIGQIHGQVIDVKDCAAENEEDLNECMRTISEKLARIQSNIPRLQIR